MPDDDATIERALRLAAAACDPVPAHLPDQAKAAFDWRTVDAELAALVYDSAEPAEPALVRGADRPRLLTFRTGELVIEVEVDGGELRGQLAPAGPSEVELQARHGEPRMASTDPLGRFALAVSGGGPYRLRCRSAGGRPVVTDWFSG